jgi:hypothetical protein
MPGGRPKGALNKVSRDVREAAMEYSDEALRTLGRIMRSCKTNPQARVAAAKELLNRAHGMPTAHLEANINLLERLNDDEQRVLAAALEAIARDKGEDVEGDGPTRH